MKYEDLEKSWESASKWDGTSREGEVYIVKDSSTGSYIIRKNNVAYEVYSGLDVRVLEKAPVTVPNNVKWIIAEFIDDHASDRELFSRTVYDPEIWISESGLDYVDIKDMKNIRIVKDEGKFIDG